MGKMKENPRYNIISMRLTDEEREALEQMTLRTRKSMSALVREAMQLVTLQADGVRR